MVRAAFLDSMKDLIGLNNRICNANTARSVPCNAMVCNDRDHPVATILTCVYPPRRRSNYQNSSANIAARQSYWDLHVQVLLSACQNETTPRLQVSGVRKLGSMTAAPSAAHKNQIHSWNSSQRTTAKGNNDATTGHCHDRRQREAQHRRTGESVGSSG